MAIYRGGSPPLPAGRAGDIVRVTVEGEAKSTVTFSIDGIPGKQSMGLVNYRTYSGNYTIKDGDNVTDALVTITLTDAKGNTATDESHRITIDTIPPPTPDLSVVGDKIDASNVTNVQITGKASAGASLTVTLSDNINVPIQTTAEANSSGIFEAIVDASPLQNGEIEVTAVEDDDSSGNHGEVAKIKVTKDITQTSQPSFQLTAVQDYQSVGRDGTVTYNLSIVGTYGFEGEVELSAVDLPAGVSASFDHKKVTPTKGAPLRQSELTLTVSGDASIGPHNFTVIAKSGGKYQEIYLSLEIFKTLCNTTLSVIVDEDTIEFGQPIEITGKLELKCDASESFEIKLTFESPSSNKSDRFPNTKAENQQYSATFDEIGELGDWSVKASFEKEGYQQANDIADFTVIKGTSTIEWLSPPEPTSIDRSRTLRGKLYPNLEGKSINLREKRPGSSFRQIATIKTDSDGIFSYEVTFDEVGDWEYKATWWGDEYYRGSESEIHKIPVRKESGVFLLVLGGGDEITNKDWNTYNELAKHVYNSIKKCNFSDDEIYFLSPSKYSSEKVDKKTTLDNLEEAITVWAKGRVSQNIPFYLYLLSHNTEQQFLLEKYADKPPVYITPDDVRTWIDELPEEAQSTIIVEACYSGQFIPKLANGDRRRVIIASSRDDQQSTIEKGLYSFSKYFFDSVSHPHDLKTAVEYSQKWVYDGFKKKQYPVFDTDGDGIPANPDDTYEYDLLADRYIYVEKGISLANEPVIHNVEVVPQHLSIPNSGASIKVTLLEPTESTVTVIVVPLNFEPSPISPVVKFDTITLTHVGNHVYEGKYEGFTEVGEYTILIEATNIDGASEPDLVTVIVGESYDLNGDGVINIQDLVIVGKHFGESGEGVQGDVNRDETVDINDLVIVGKHLGETIY